LTSARVRADIFGTFFTPIEQTQRTISCAARFLPGPWVLKGRCLWRECLATCRGGHCGLPFGSPSRWALMVR